MNISSFYLNATDDSSSFLRRILSCGVYKKVCIFFVCAEWKYQSYDLKFTRLFQKFSLDNNCFTSMSKCIFCSIVYLHGKWRYIKTYVRVSLFWPAKWWHWNENILFKLKRVFKNRHKISHHMIFDIATYEKYFVLENAFISGLSKFS